MTWEQIKQSEKDFLTPSEIGEFLQCNPQTLRVAVKTNKDLVGFHCSMIGQTVRIPRLAFIRWVEGGEF